MDKAILIIHVVTAVVIVVVILLQRSSADGGAAFGGGSQQSLLGTAGSTPLLTKVTVGLVSLFFVTSLVLAYWNRHSTADRVLILPAEETIESRSATEPRITINPVDDDLPAEAVE